MEVTVRTASLPIDQTVTRLAESFRRPESWSVGACPGPAPTVRVAALGYRDALAVGHAEETGDGTVVPVWLERGAVVVGPRCDGAVPRGGCPLCLERRWQALRSAPERHALEGDREWLVPGPLPDLIPFAVDLLRELVGVVATAATGETHGAATVYRVRLDTFEITRTALLPDSSCPACAQPRPDVPEEAEICLKFQRKPCASAVRARSAAALDIPLRALVNPVCGVLGAATFRSFRPGAGTTPASGRFRVWSQWDLHDMWWSGHSSTYAASERHAVLEGMERHAGLIPRGKAVCVRDSYQNLFPAALDPAGLSYPAEVYATNPHYAPYAPDRAIRWVWGYSLRDHRALLVPEQLVYYLDHQRGEQRFVQECSNGCASGTSLEEAILHGMLELIERDAFLVNWYGRGRMAEIDTASLSSMSTRLLLDRVDLSGYRMRLFDLRTDLPVPAVLAVAVRREAGLGAVCLAAGASLDPEDAIHAAVCETASYVADFPQRVENRLADARAMAADYRRVESLTDHPLLYGLPEMAAHCDFFLADAPVRTVDELYRDWSAQRPATLDLSDDVRHLVALIAGTGSDVIAVDQTSPEQAAIGLRTACVIAPGLVPIDFGWQRQRAPHHPRVHAFVARGRHGPEGLGATGFNPHPHPFP